MREHAKGSWMEKTRLTVVKGTVEHAFRENAGSLSRFLRRFFNSSADVEDLLQETFLKVFEAEHTTNIVTPRAFLFKTAKNLALNELGKRRTRRTEAVADLDLLDVISTEQEASASNPEAQAVIEERLKLASAAVDALSPRVREVFLLRKVHGLKQREIAARLGIAESTVEKHIAKGLAQITSQQQEG